MSQTSPETPVERMDRSELATEVRDLREEVEELREFRREQARDMAIVKKAIARFYDDALAEEWGVTDLPAAGKETRERLDERHAALASEVALDTENARSAGTDRVRTIRRALVRDAQAGEGTAAMNYHEVRGLFATDDEGYTIGSSWANKLVDRAAEGHTAFRVKRAGGGAGPKQVRVDLAVMDSADPLRGGRDG